MAPGELDQIRELFHRALDLPPTERAAFLNAECDDANIRAEVETLLSGADAHILDSSAIEGVRKAVGALGPGKEVLTAPMTDETDGRMIGRYRLLQQIGEGGMGEVWLAEQREPVRRRVALKLIKAGMNTREVMARFESERQALALMDHPAIAKVFDAGSTDQGSPYFVMEYVAGVPITAYCDNHKISTRERLAIFMQVCEGVQHAHQKAIIHRDLKPSNILVTEVDGRAAPKIIDFGVAKALAQRLTAETVFTRVGALVGTPEYMSPEQATSTGEDVDTRTDVYSLGVIFYELLAGAPPLELRKIAFDELLRRLREEEPPKPSTKIQTQDPAAAEETARKRHTEPPMLAKEIRGDLDSIALKALEKDRARRYSSPSDLAADVGRYLQNEAVLAVPPSLVYRARKLVRRYRGVLAIAAAFVLVLIVAAVISIGQSIRASHEAAVAQAVSDFLQNDLLAQASAANQSGPSTKPDPDLKVRTALDRAAARIAGKFDGQPEVEAAIRDTIGQTYIDLGLYPQARAQLEQARNFLRRALGATNPKTLKTLSRIAEAAVLQGKYPEAEALFSQTLKMQRRALGTAHPDTLYSINGLANVYRVEGKYAQAETLFNEGLKLAPLVLSSGHPQTEKFMYGLATVYFMEGKYPQAETLYSQTLDIHRRILGPEHPGTLRTMIALTDLYYEEGKLVEAEAIGEQALEINRRVLGTEHQDTLASMNNLALVYVQEGKYSQAEMLQRQDLDIERRVLGPEHPSTLMAMDNLGNSYIAQGKYMQAEALLNEALQIQRRVLGPEHTDTLFSMDNLASAYSGEGKYAQAEALYRRTLETRRRVLGPENPATLLGLSAYASMYQRQGNYALAETYFAEDLAALRHRGEKVYAAGTSADVALAYVSQGKFVESERFAREALEFFSKEQSDDWSRFRAEIVLGASLAGEKKYAEAEPLLIEGYQGMVARKERIAVPDWYHLDRAREWIVQLYQAWGNPEKAAEWKKKKY
jgi:eukaryotic-like serine/threonine-protein kinase